MKKHLTLLFLIVTLYSFSQAVDLPRNAEPGKCYQKCQFEDFKYDEKFKGSLWKEIDCHLIKKETSRKSNLTVEQYRNRIKFKKYQEKLISLGYKIEVSNHINKKFIKAHNKYRKIQKKAAQKLQKK